MRVELIESSEELIRADAMLPGQIGVVDKSGPGSYVDKHLLKSYGPIICLDAPKLPYWEGNCAVLVRVLPPGTTLKLTVEI